MNVLKASCGTFTRLRGTETVIHYSKKFPSNVAFEMEAAEISQMRTLRHALANGSLDNARLERPTLNLFLATILCEIARLLPQGVPIVQVGGRLSPEFEALKLLHAMGKLSLESAQVVCVIPAHVEPYWKAFHHAMEAKPYGEMASLELRSSIDDQWLGSHSWPGLVFANAFKTAHGEAEQLLDWLTGMGRPTSADGPTYVLAVRCSADTAKPATNVLRETFTLRPYEDILRALAAAGWNVGYRFVPNLDRDYLLPLEGAYGLLLVAASQDEALLSRLPSLTCYQARSSTENRIVALTQDQASNYDLTLSSEIPALGKVDEPDWDQWCMNYSWNPAAVDWNGFFRAK